MSRADGYDRRGAAVVVSVRPWLPTSAAAAAEFDRVIGLHRKNRATLGHLPFAAFEEAGRRDRLLIGEVDGIVEGYLLYSTPRQQTLKLVHVCSSTNARGTGLAKAMVEFAVASNPDRSMITAHCRSDYGIDGFWRSLDMTPSAERPGRAAKGSTLTIWTRRIGEFDLLENALYASSRPLAVLDSNVVIDLFSSEAIHRPDRQESLGLTEDWVVDLLDLSVSPEVEVDINSFQPAAERHQVQASLTRFVPVRRDDAMRATANAIFARMPQALVTRDTSLNNDAKHLADAILAGADFFVTRDQNLLDATRDWIQKDYGLEVVRPVELLQRLIPPTPLTEFRSDQLESVGLRWVHIAASDNDLEDTFLDTLRGEKRSSFRKQLQAILARPATSRLEMLVDERGRRWALLGTEVAAGQVTVHTVRIGRGRLGATIAFQLVRYLRSLALARGANSIVVAESFVDQVLQAALEADGFTETPLTAPIARHPESSSVAAYVTPDDVANYERRNWPQVLLDRDVPVWIVPIQPQFARELIGFNNTLLRTREKQALGLAREFVYFASPKIKRWTLPARVLWYVSKDSKALERTAVRAVVAHSRIVDYSVLDVDDAVEQYRSLGVFRKQEIEARAHRGEVLVLRFEDTQPLQVPVGRKTLDGLLQRHNVTDSLITMRAASPSLFDDLLRLQPDYEVDR